MFQNDVKSHVTTISDAIYKQRAGMRTVWNCCRHSLANWAPPMQRLPPLTTNIRVPQWLTRCVRIRYRWGCAIFPGSIKHISQRLCKQGYRNNSPWPCWGCLYLEMLSKYHAGIWAIHKVLQHENIAATIVLKRWYGNVSCTSFVGMPSCMTFVCFHLYDCGLVCCNDGFSSRYPVLIIISMRNSIKWVT